MSMKKKFLALALAGAVAMPVVANASANLVQNSDDTKPAFGNVGVTGVVESSTGQAPAGRIQVELPSAMTFTVNKNGNVTVPNNYEVYNQGAKPVKVEVVGFTETNPSAGINIVNKSTFSSGTDQNHRSDVALTLQGTGSEVDLSSALSSTNTGVIFDSLAAGDRRQITLRAIAGTKADTGAGNETELSQGIDEDFSIQFKITAQ